MDEEVRTLKSQTGNDITCDYKFADEIAKIYEKSKQNSWPDFTIKFKKDLSTFEDSSSKVLSYYVSLYSLYDTIKGLTTDVFEWKGQGHGLPLPIREDEESGREGISNSGGNGL